MFYKSDYQTVIFFRLFEVLVFSPKTGFKAIKHSFGTGTNYANYLA